MRRWIATLVFLGCPVSVLAAVPQPARPEMVVIVHPGNPVTSVERTFLADAFLKKTSRWPDDRVIWPVDLAATSYTRRIFSDSVLRRSVAAVKRYWQQIVFSGRGVPPPEFGSDAEIVTYVLAHAGAVGYVSGQTDVSHVKIVSLR